MLVVADTHPLAGRKRIRMIELHQQRLVLLPDYFATRTLLDECFKASGAEQIVVAEMSTIAPMLGLVLRMPIAAIAAINAVPAAMKGLCMIPLESPTPIRTPGILGHIEILVGIEVLHLASDSTIERGGIKLRDGPDSTAPFFQTGPSGGQILAEWGDTSNAGDDDASFAHN